MNPNDLLNPRAVRSIYLITYSQADLSKVPSRESFAGIVNEAFHNTDSNSLRARNNEQSVVQQWVCCQEPHTQTEGVHYHMAVKLCRRLRWIQVRHYLARRYQVNVHFTSSTPNYYRAWQYVTKEDISYIQSTNHPDLTNTRAPQTTEASVSRLSRHSSNRPRARQRQSKRKGLSVYEVSQIAVRKGLRTRLQVLAMAESQKREGKLELAQFVANRGLKTVDEAVRVGWGMFDAPQELQRQQVTRFELLENAFTENCIPHCNGKWFRLSREILQNNGIAVNEFAQAVRTLLIEGRGKKRNVLLHGKTNCGKTFLLQPLNVLYKTFTNPASTSFAWVGAESSEVIFLNDFRWSPQVIAWHDFLLLLEGQKVHLAAPKTHYSQDILLEHDVPVFCTTKQPFTYVRGGVVDLVEGEMMASRWKTFAFTHQISVQDQVETPPCGRCFAELMLSVSP